MDGAALRFMLMAFAGWWSDQRQGALAYLIEENRILVVAGHTRGSREVTVISAPFQHVLP